jgi:hypothetical protein
LRGSDFKSTGGKSSESAGVVGEEDGAAGSGEAVWLQAFTLEENIKVLSRQKVTSDESHGQAGRRDRRDGLEM